MTAEIDVFGIPVRPFHIMKDAVNWIVDPQTGQVRSGFAVAINPEKVVRAQHDAALRQALASATLRYADGIGVVWAMRRLGVPSGRIPGCELWEALMSRCGQTGAPVYLVGARPEVLQQVCDKLQTQYGVTLAGVTDGFFDRKATDELIRKIAASGAKFVAVAMGSPTQETFIARCRQVYPDCFYMGVGGSFDVYSGVVNRAPAAWRWLHLEWLFRMLASPSRLLRQRTLLTFVRMVVANGIKKRHRNY
jgi:UDP-N-acetyl-D-mannosaminouronate:lipid I N-acetyl-D-mannosaminouronosyltransferase